MRAFIGAAVLAAALVATSARGETVSVHGVDRSCWSISDLDRALSGGAPGFFTGWTDDDFESARVWAQACKDSGWQFSRPYRLGLLARVQQSMHDAERQRADADASRQKLTQDQQRQLQEAADQKRRNEEAEARRRAAQENLDAQSACQATDAYQLYFSQEEIIGFRDGIASDREDLARQHHIAKVSGVRDLAAERSLGESIVSQQEQMALRFSDYRRLGGKAKSPAAVTHRLGDPCSPPLPKQSAAGQ